VAALAHRPRRSVGSVKLIEQHDRVFARAVCISCS
jgi:hypothetical protein